VKKLELIKGKHLGNFNLLSNVASGACQECAVKHDPKMPHNQQSLFWQYKFYNKHGRWPKWEDAMAHCTDEMKECWREALRERGVAI